MNISKLAGSGVITAIAASLCCITPVLALLAGSGSMASSVSWIEPARPYLIGLTIIVLGFAWFQQFKPKLTDDCVCTVDDKPSFLQSKTFLLLVTIFAVLMILFPFYAKAFYPKIEKSSATIEKSNIQTVELSIKGMTCEGCEAHVNLAVNKLPGIIQSTVSYENRNAVIQFNSSKTTVNDIIDAVHATGYNVINQTLKK